MKITFAVGAFFLVLAVVFAFAARNDDLATTRPLPLQYTPIFLLNFCPAWNSFSASMGVAGLRLIGRRKASRWGAK